MNVFATLRTVFFGSKFLSAPVPADGTPCRAIASALGGQAPLCRQIPGARLALDIREGQVILVFNWTPRTDGKVPVGSYHYIVSGKEGVREVADLQAFPSTNGVDNLPERAAGSLRNAATPDKKAEVSPVQAKEACKEPKSHALMQQVTAFLTSRYRFRFNVLAEETEVAGREEDNPQEVLTLSATQLFERMKAVHPSAMRGMTAYSLSRILPQLGERVHTVKGNVDRVVAC